MKLNVLFRTSSTSAFNFLNWEQSSREINWVQESTSEDGNRTMNNLWNSWAHFVNNFQIEDAYSPVQSLIFKTHQKVAWTYFLFQIGFWKFIWHVLKEVEHSAQKVVTFSWRKCVWWKGDHVRTPTSFSTLRHNRRCSDTIGLLLQRSNSNSPQF